MGRQKQPPAGRLGRQRSRERREVEGHEEPPAIVLMDEREDVGRRVQRAVGALAAHEQLAFSGWVGLLGLS